MSPRRTHRPFPRGSLRTEARPQPVAVTTAHPDLQRAPRPSDAETDRRLAEIVRLEALRTLRQAARPRRPEPC